MAFSKLNVGILGGGQLARMMILKGHEMGLRMHVLCPVSDEPAAQVTRYWHKGDPNVFADVKHFLSQVDLATFESEFLNPDLLLRAQHQTHTKILPKPQVMGLLQDRLSQKRLLQKSRIPTAEFFAVSSWKQAVEAFESFPGGMVLKKRRFGYDGYGTFVINSMAQLAKMQKTIEEEASGFIAEEKIPFQRELAVILARRQNGQQVQFPLVQSKQVQSRCFWVKGPIHHSKSSALVKKLQKLLDKIKYQGLIAFEIFDTEGKLLINEVAPRVHNSGHYSLDTASVDQFSLHLKSILNMALDKPQAVYPGFAMINLLGKTGKAPKWELQEGVRLHWYGKTVNRPGRKMGHINCGDKSAEKALNRLLKAHKEFTL